MALAVRIRPSSGFMSPRVWGFCGAGMGTSTGYETVPGRRNTGRRGPLTGRRGGAEPVGGPAVVACGQRVPASRGVFGCVSPAGCSLRGPRQLVPPRLAVGGARGARGGQACIRRVRPTDVGRRRMRRGWHAASPSAAGCGQGWRRRDRPLPRVMQGKSEGHGHVQGLASEGGGRAKGHKLRQQRGAGRRFWRRRAGMVTR